MGGDVCLWLAVGGEPSGELVDFFEELERVENGVVVGWDVRGVRVNPLLHA